MKIKSELPSLICLKELSNLSYYFDMKRFIRTVFILFAFLMLPFFIENVAAQPPPPEDPAAPIDGGLTFLVVAGAAYGARKLYKNQKEEQSISNENK